MRAKKAERGSERLHPHPRLRVELIAPTAVSAAPNAQREAAAGRQWWSEVTCGGVFVRTEQNKGKCGASNGVGGDLHANKKKNNSSVVNYWGPDVTHRLIRTTGVRNKGNETTEPHHIDFSK